MDFVCVCVPHGFVNMMSSMSLNLLHITVKSQLHDVCILSFQKRVCIHLDLEFVFFYSMLFLMFAIKCIVVLSSLQ